MTTDLHPAIAAALDDLRGTTFSVGELMQACQRHGFNRLQAGFAARECWVRKLVRWSGPDRSIGRVVS